MCFARLLENIHLAAINKTASILFTHGCSNLSSLAKNSQLGLPQISVIASARCDQRDGTAPEILSGNSSRSNLKTPFVYGIQHVLGTFLVIFVFCIQ
jgi:hypothetical protein